MTEEEITHLEARWKSDVDKKLDRLTLTADRFDAFYDQHTPLLRMLLDREASRKKWRDAVIEKSTIGFIWAAIVFFAAAAWEYVRSRLR